MHHISIKYQNRNSFVGAYAGCLTEFIIITSATIGIFRHEVKKKQ